MRLKILAAAALALIPMISHAWTVPDETIHYQIHYKWGFLSANAGTATIKAENIPGTNKFRATLTGKSVELLGHEYVGADTIVGTLLADKVQSLMTTHLSYTSGEFEIQTITYPNGSQSDGEIVKKLPDGKVVRSRISHYGGGLTVDLLGVYYYMRQIDYEQMETGQTVKVNIFSGTKPETLTVTYLGKEIITGPHGPAETFSVSLNFSTPGANGTTDHIDAWISTEPDRIPVRVVGSLKFGKIDCMLTAFE